MNTTTTTSEPPVRRRHLARRVFSVVFGVLGVLGVLVSVVAIWAHQVIFDASTMSEAVELTLLEPEVTDALGEFLTDQVMKAVDVEKLIEEELPAELTRFAPVLNGGVRTIVNNALTQVLEADTTREVIVAATERAHKAIMKVLEGGELSGALTVDGEDVKLNLLPIVSRGLEALQDAGLLTRVDLPTLEAGGDPAEQIAELEDAIGRPLPDDFGQMVVYESDKIADAQAAVSGAQQALVIFRRSIAVIIGLTVVSLVACIALAVRRRRALAVTALGMVAAMGLGRAVVKKVVEEVPALAVKPASRTALRTIVETVADGLLTAVTAAIIAGLIVAVLSWLTGGSRTARGVRGRASSTGTSLRSVATEHRDGVAIAAFGLAVLVIAVYGFTALPIIIALLLVVVGAAAFLLPGHHVAPTDT